MRAKYDIMAKTHMRRMVMGLFNILNKKQDPKQSDKKEVEQGAPNECIRCFLPINGRVYCIDNKNLCKECYNKKMRNDLDFYFSTNNDEYTSNLKIIIFNNNRDSSTALCIHGQSHEVYIICGNNPFLQVAHKDRHIENQISSIALASLEDVATIVNFECDYTTFHKEKNSNILQTSHKNLLIDGKPYRIEWFVVVDDVEISMNEIFSNEKVFDVPAQCLTKEQHTKYAEYYHRPGPYEHYFTLPAECCQKLIRKLIPLEF
jgi:hypothetical protein